MQADENLLACTVPSPGDPELGAVCLSSTQTGPAHLGLSHSSDSHRSLFPPLAHCYCPAAPFARLHAAAARSQSCLCPDCAHRPPAKLSVLSLASSHPHPHHVAVISSSASPLHTSALPRPPPPCSGCRPCTGCYPTAGILPLPMAASSFQAGILWAFLPPAPSLLLPPPHPHKGWSPDPEAPALSFLPAFAHTLPTPQTSIAPSPGHTQILPPCTSLCNKQFWGPPPAGPKVGSHVLPQCWVSWNPSRRPPHCRCG